MFPAGWDLKVIEVKGDFVVGVELEVTVDDGTHDLDHIGIRVEEIQPDGTIKGKTDYYSEWTDFVLGTAFSCQWMSVRPPEIVLLSD